MKFFATTIVEWRSWLQRHHDAEQRVLMVRPRRHTGRPTFSNSDAMDEAICFGWIDTTLKRVDDDHYGVNYVRRGEKSRWSQNTVARAERLIAAGRMQPAGLRAYKHGLSKPLLQHFPKRVPVPEELNRELARSKRARAFFDGLAPSYRRIYTVMVAKAKRAETREKRAKIVADRCRAGKRPAD